MLEAQPPTADGPKRLVPSGEMFDVLYDTHVDEGGHRQGPYHWVRYGGLLVYIARRGTR